MFGKVLGEVLVELYYNFGAAVVLTFFIMIAIFVLEEKGIGASIRQAFLRLKDDKKYRRKILFALFLSLLLFETLLCRQIWVNPLSNVIENWSLYTVEGE